MEKESGLTVGGELDREVAEVQEFGGEVSFPEAGEAFGPENREEGGEGAFVDRGAVEVAGGEGVGEGVGLELEADFDYV